MFHFTLLLQHSSEDFCFFKNYITVDNIVCFYSKVLYDMLKDFFKFNNQKMTSENSSI